MFFKCEYAKWILKEGMEAIESLVNMANTDTFEDAARELNRVTTGTPSWGL